MKHSIATIKKAFEMLLRYASSKNYILTASRLHKLQKEIDGCEKELIEFYKGKDFSAYVLIQHLLCKSGEEILEGDEKR